MSTDFGICPFDPPSFQQENKRSDDWIGAFMEWMDREWTDRSGSPREASAHSSESFVVACLEWMDADLRTDEPRRSGHATASADYRRIKDEGATEPDAIVGTVLLAA